jgi:hypothetical protein
VCLARVYMWVCVDVSIQVLQYAIVLWLLSCGLNRLFVLDVACMGSRS